MSNKTLKFQCEPVRLGTCFVNDLFLHNDKLWIVINRSSGAVLATEVCEGEDQISYLFESDTEVLKLIERIAKFRGPISKIKKWMHWRGITGMEATYATLVMLILILVTSLLIYAMIQI